MSKSTQKQCNLGWPNTAVGSVTTASQDTGQGQQLNNRRRSATPTAGHSAHVHTNPLMLIAHTHSRWVVDEGGARAGRG